MGTLAVGDGSVETVLWFLYRMVFTTTATTATQATAMPTASATCPVPHAADDDELAVFTVLAGTEPEVEASVAAPATVAAAPVAGAGAGTVGKVEGVAEGVGVGDRLCKCSRPQAAV